MQSKTVLAAFNRLTTVAGKLQYTCWYVPDAGGQHFFAQRLITIGRDQSFLDRLITLAHELGHVADLAQRPFSEDEVAVFSHSWEDYERSLENLRREQHAWAYARALLVQLGVWSEVRGRFRELRDTALNAYTGLTAHG